MDARYSYNQQNVQKQRPKKRVLTEKEIEKKVRHERRVRQHYKLRHHMRQICYEYIRYTYSDLLESDYEDQFIKDKLKSELLANLELGIQDFFTWRNTEKGKKKLQIIKGHKAVQNDPQNGNYESPQNDNKNYPSGTFQNGFQTYDQSTPYKPLQNMNPNNIVNNLPKKRIILIKKRTVNINDT